MKELNREHYEIINGIMQNHRGASSAITLLEIAMRSGIRTEAGRPDRRAVEIVLQTCKDDFPFIIVGSSKGMYVATDCEDLNHEIHSRSSRIKNIQIGISAVKRKAKSLGWKLESDHFVEAPAQQELELL